MSREIKTVGLTVGLPAAQNPTLGENLTAKLFVFHETEKCKF